jgi:hypothetical protein
MFFHFLKKSSMSGNPERERERESKSAESKQVRRLAVINFLLILTVAFLVKVLFDLNRSLANPPHQSGSFVSPSQVANQNRLDTNQ